VHKFCQCKNGTHVINIKSTDMVENTTLSVNCNKKKVYSSTVNFDEETQRDNELNIAENADGSTESGKNEKSASSGGVFSDIFGGSAAAPSSRHNSFTISCMFGVLLVLNVLFNTNLNTIIHI
jgi:hypothetical protein